MTWYPLGRTRMFLKFVMARDRLLEGLISRVGAERKTKSENLEQKSETDRRTSSSAFENRG